MSMQQTAWHVSGMHCPHCETAILRAPLSPGDNIVEFTVDESGVIPYTCWIGMLHGTITAVE